MEPRIVGGEREESRSVCEVVDDRGVEGEECGQCLPKTWWAFPRLALRVLHVSM